MKILMSSSYFASHNGGLELVAGELFHAFTDKGHEVVWMAGDITPPPQPEGKSRTVSLRILNFVEDKIGVPFPIPTPGSLRRIVREVKKADVLLLHDCLYLSNILTFLATRWRGVPIVIIQHIGLVPYRSFLLKFVMRLANSVISGPMLSTADQVVFISKTTKSYFGDLHFKRSPELIFNGVDTRLYHPVRGKQEKSDSRRKYDLPTDRPVILFVGRFVEKKGLSVLKVMVGQRQNWLWAFAGSGPIDPKAWDAANVRVFPWLTDIALAGLYRACDALVLPSRGEGFPLVIQEALASGLPVICGEETSVADPDMAALVRGVPIHVKSDQRTAQEFLLSMDDLIGSDLAENASERISAFAASRYSRSTAVDRYLRIFARCALKTESSTQATEINAGIVR